MYLHRVGTAQEGDVLLYEEPDDGFFVGVSKTREEHLGFRVLGVGFSV